jgi:hypothetical protein
MTLRESGGIVGEQDLEVAKCGVGGRHVASARRKRGGSAVRLSVFVLIVDG